MLSEAFPPSTEHEGDIFNFATRNNIISSTRTRDPRLPIIEGSPNETTRKVLCPSMVHDILIL
jgi:hypothetical protein